jgi:hypothetical protein
VAAGQRKSVTVTVEAGWRPPSPTRRVVRRSACPPRALTGGQSRSLNVTHEQHVVPLTWDDARSRRSRTCPERPYKAEDGGSSPSAPTIGDNDFRACYARLDNVCGRWVREKSVRFAARFPKRPMGKSCGRTASPLEGVGTGRTRVWERFGARFGVAGPVGI